MRYITIPDAEDNIKTILQIKSTFKMNDVNSTYKTKTFKIRLMISLSIKFLFSFSLLILKWWSKHWCRKFCKKSPGIAKNTYSYISSIKSLVAEIWKSGFLISSPGNCDQFKQDSEPMTWIAWVHVSYGFYVLHRSIFHSPYPNKTHYIRAWTKAILTLCLMGSNFNPAL